MRKLITGALLLATAMLAACEKIDRLAQTNSNAAEVKSGVKVPLNMRRAFIDPAIADGASLVVTLPNESEIRLGAGDGEPVTKNDLSGRIKEYVDRQPADKRQVYLKADAGITFARLEEVLDQLRVNKVEKFNLVVSQNERHDSPPAVLPVNLPGKQSHADRTSVVKPYPFTLVVFIAPDGRLLLNRDDAGNLSDTAPLIGRLFEVFKMRAEDGLFRPGSNEVEKTVRVRPGAAVRYADVAKLIDALIESGAAPVYISLKDSKD